MQKVTWRNKQWGLRRTKHSNLTVYSTQSGFCHCFSFTVIHRTASCINTRNITIYCTSFCQAQAQGCVGVVDGTYTLGFQDRSWCLEKIHSLPFWSFHTNSKLNCWRVSTTREGGTHHNQVLKSVRLPGCPDGYNTWYFMCWYCKLGEYALNLFIHFLWSWSSSRVAAVYCQLVAGLRRFALSLVA